MQTRRWHDQPVRMVRSLPAQSLTAGQSLKGEINVTSSRLIKPLSMLSAPLIVGAALLGHRPAAALPAYADQTGQACRSCHVGGFGPQLTPFGREFKLRGYTLRAKSFNVPLSAMAVASYVHTKKAQDEPPTDHSKTNDNAAFDEGSIFLAGGIGSHL